MRAEALSALVVSADDSFFQSVADCLHWAGSETIGRVRTGKAAAAEIAAKRFFYSAVVIHVEEDVSYEVEFIQSLLHGRDASLRSMPVIAIATVKSREFYAELTSMGLAAVVPAPMNRVLLRNTLFKIFRDLQLEYRSPDPRVLRRALANGDVDFVEERCIRALQHQPQNGLLRSYLGEVYFRQGKFERALEQADAAVAGAAQELPLDAIRLKAKTLHKMGKTELAYAVLPQLIKAQVSERSAIGGMIGVLNSYAGHLKSSGNIEESLVYYNMALAEPEASEYRVQLGLNVALAFFAGNKLSQAYMAASQSLAASGGKSRKARELIAYIEKNHPPAAYGPEPLPDLRKSAVRGAQSSRNRRASDSSGLNEFDGQAASARGGAAWRERQAELGSEDLAALEAQLTEEVDLPPAGNGAPLNKSPLVNDVFYAMKMLGTEDGSALSTGARAKENPLASSDTLDSVGDSLGIESTASADEFDFEVSDSSLAAAREQLKSPNLGKTGSPDFPSSSLSDLDSALFLAIENQSFDSPADILIQDASRDLFGEFGEFSLEQENVVPQQAAPRLASAKAAAQPPKVGAAKKSVAPAAPAKPGNAPAAKGALPAEEVKKEESGIPGEGEKINWRTMSEESLLAYIMFEKEYPRIKVKPQKIQARKRVQANVNEFD